jgi:hypothetical protein
MRFIEAYNFLYNHPAFAGDFENCCHFIPVEVCKNGYCLDAFVRKVISLYPGDDRFQEFWDKASEDDKYEDFYDGLHKITVDYVEYFGYPYEIDHVEFWVEVGPKRKFFDPNRSDDFNRLSNYQTWHDYELNVKNCRTYEEAIIKTAEAVKERYGDFSIDSMTPDWVKENNDKLNLMDCFKKIEDDPNPDLNGDYEYIPNPEYIFIMEEDANEIWWQDYFISKFPEFDSSEMCGYVKDISHFRSKEKWAKYWKDKSPKVQEKEEVLPDGNFDFEFYHKQIEKLEKFENAHLPS